jgi:hypothetical protein
VSRGERINDIACLQDIPFDQLVLKIFAFDGIQFPTNSCVCFFGASKALLD